MTGKRLPLGGVALALGLLQILASCGNRDRTAPVESFEQMNARFQKVLAGLASAHGAVLQWMPRSFSLYDHPVYTIDYERAMVRVEPIALIARVTDLTRHGDGYQLQLEVDQQTYELRCKVLLELQLDRAQGDRILVNRPDEFGEVAVVAKIDSVRSADLRLTHHSLSDSTIEAEIEFGDSAIVAAGRCLALTVLPFDYSPTKEKPQR